MFKVLIRIVTDDGYDDHVESEQFANAPRVGEFIEIGREGITYEVVQVLHQPHRPTVGPVECAYAVWVERRELPHPIIPRSGDETAD